MSTLHTVRSRGATIGPVLILLGLWGAFAPVAGPHLGYAVTPDRPWTFTWPLFWLELVPGAVTVVAGVILTATANRISGSVAAGFGVASGVWFAVGPLLWTVVTDAPAPLGTPLGGTRQQALEQIGMLTGLGVVVAGLAAVALGRFSIVGVRDPRRTTPGARSSLLADVPAQRTASSFEADPRWTRERSSRRR